MMQSTLHVAIIMDGNGRWAQARGLPRIAGHSRGADAVRRTVEAAPGLGVSTLTLYAFSSDNWKRPADEVAGIMTLFRRYIDREIERCVDKGVRFSVIGRRDRLAPDLQAAIECAERRTENGKTLHLRIAVDYSSRDMILRAGERCTAWSREGFARALGAADHSGASAPDVDLVLRTSGEKRLSDFLLWECAYAEMYFLERMWPDFHGDDLAEAVASFRSRDRRYGGLSPAA